MKKFVGSVAQENFPTSGNETNTTVTIPEKLPIQKKCDEALFCTLADRCDGINCLIRESER